MRGVGWGGQAVVVVWHERAEACIIKRYEGCLLCREAEGFVCVVEWVWSASLALDVCG